MKHYRVSNYLADMCDYADKWPGWQGGFILWAREQDTWDAIELFILAHEELRHATMLEF